MKGATNCARNVKQLFRTLRTRLGKVNRPQTGDPITQLILGVLTRDVPEAKARDALDRMKAMVVDYNELRVIPAFELAESVGDYPDARSKCEDISRALNRVFAIEHSVSLDRIAAASKVEINNYLNGIPGLDAYSRARVRLLGMNQHAVPLDEAMWAYARHEELVDPKCTLDDAQAFLERQIEAEELMEFVALLRKAAWNDFGGAVRKGEVEKIRSIPPDRTTRNMLQLIASGGSLDNDTDVEAEFGLPDAIEPGEEEPALIGPEEVGENAKPKKSGKSGKSEKRPEGKSKAKSDAKPRKSASKARPA